MKRCLLQVLASLGVLAGLRASGESYTWTQYGDGAFTWSTPANWSGGNAPSVGGAADAVVTLLPDMAHLLANGTRQVSNNDLGSSGVFTLNQLNLNGWTHFSGNAQSPAGFGGSSLVLQGAQLNFTGAGARLSFLPTYNWMGNLRYDIDCDINLDADTTFYHYNAATVPPTMSINGVISGGGRLTVDNTEQNGNFAFALTGSNTFTGGVTVGPSSGRMQLYISEDANLGAVPAGPVADYLRLRGSITAATDVTIDANRGITLIANGAGGLRGTGGWLTYGGVITDGAASYYMSGSGLIRLTGTNSDFGGYIWNSAGHPLHGQPVAIYTADATIEVMKIANEGVNSSVGSSGAVWIDGGGGGTFRYIGTGDTSDRTIGSDKSLRLESSGSGALTLTGTIARSPGVQLILGGTHVGTSSGQITGTGNLFKDGTGSWTISGTNASTGTTGLQNGTLTLDYTVQNNNKISSSGALTLGALGASAVLNVLGNNAAATTQSVTATTLAAGSGSTIHVTGGTGAGANTALSLGALTRNANSTLAVIYSTPGAGTAGVTTTTGNNAAGILGGWATVNGSDWATVSGGTLIALPAYTGPLPTAGGGANDNDVLAGGQAQAGAVSINTLKITDTGAGQSLDLAGNGLTFGSVTGGLLYAGGTSNSYQITNSGATAYVGAGATGEFLVHTAAGTTLDIAARLIGNGTAGSLTKAGAGTLVLSGAGNNYTGGTTIAAGTLMAGTANAVGNGGAFRVNTGAVFDLNGFDVATGNIAGYGTITNRGAANATLTIGSAHDNWNFYGTISDGPTNTTAVRVHSAYSQYMYGASTYTGLTQVTGGWLFASNLTDGGLPSGIGQSSSAAGNILLNGGGLGYVGSANGSTDRLFTLGTSGGSVSNQPNGQRTFTWSNPGAIAFSGSGNRTLTLQATGYNSRTGAGALLVFNPLLADGPGGVTNVTVQGSGGYSYTGVSRLDNSNTYTGTTTVNNYGILRAADGVGLPTASPLVLTGGVFESLDTSVTRGLGAAAGQVRLTNAAYGSGFSAGTRAGLIVAIGGLGSPTALQWGAADFDPSSLILNETEAAGNLEFRNAIDLNSAAAARTLRVNATTAAAATVSGILSNSAGTGGLIKEGGGVLALASANTYTGKTTVANGMLAFNSIGNVSGGASALGNPGTVVDGTIDLGSGTNTAALRYTGPTASTDRVVNLAGTTGGVMIDGSGSGPLTFTSAFTATGAGNKTLYLTGDTGGILQGAIVNGPSSTTSLIKAGAGVWELAAPQSYTGTTTIQAGTLRARDSDLATSGIFIRADNPNNLNSVWETDQDITRGTDATPAAGKVRLYANSWYSTPGCGGAGFSARGANINLALGAAGGGPLQTLQWSAAGFLGAAQKLVLNDTTATGTINVQNPINFNGWNGANGFINIANHATGGAATAVTLSGVLSNGGFAKSGPGTLVLGNAGNTFTGGLIVYDGTVQLGASGVLPAANNVTVYGGALDLNNTSHTITGGGGLVLGASPYNSKAAVTTGSGTLTVSGVTYTTTFTKNDTTTVHAGTATISGNLALSGTNVVFTVRNSTAAAVDLDVAATVSGSSNLYKDDPGTLALSGTNTYTGATILRGGVLSTPLVANGGLPSGIGQSSNAGGNLNFNYRATFQYTGPTVSTDRLFSFTYGDGGTLDASGTGPITFTNTGNIGLGGGTGAAYVLGLTGTNTGANTLYPVLAGSGTTGTGPRLEKTGSGTWVIASPQGFTGGLTVNDGLLVLAQANTVANNCPVTVNGGTLDFGTFSDTVNAVTLAGGAITGSGTLTATGYAVQSGAISPSLAGAANLAKTTAGTVTLTGANTYSGTTTVSAGTLVINGSHTGGGAYAVTGGTLAGNALIDPVLGAAVSVGGAAGAPAVVSPGNSIGTITVGSLASPNDVTFGDCSRLVIEVDDITLASDQFIVFGALDLTSSLNELVLSGSAPAGGNWYTIASATDGITGTFDQILWSGPINVLDVRYNPTSIEIFAVPEPGALALVALLGALAGRRRQRRG